MDNTDARVTTGDQTAHDAALALVANFRRPSVAERAQVIATARSAGATDAEIAQAFGVSPATVSRWGRGRA